MSVIRVLITGVGHPIAEGTLAGLRAAGEDTFFFVGGDIPERGRGFPWTDSHYVAPPPGTPDFVPRLLDICQREDIQVVVPWSDDEVEAVSEARDAFEALGCTLLCGPRRSIRRTLDKGTLLTELSQTDIPNPRFQLPRSPAEVEAVAMGLGYPEQRVVVKPRKGTCSRGVWILDRDTDLVNPYPGPGQQITLEGFVSFLDSISGAEERIPEYLLMEFLPGQDFSVDALADSGRALFVLPRKRLKTEGGISQVGEFVGDPEVRTMVERVIEEFELHLNVNLQLKYSEVNGGLPLLYEINPRISGSVAANNGAGINLLYHGIRLALGREVPAPGSIRAKEGTMTRSWIPRFTPGKSNFTA